MKALVKRNPGPGLWIEDVPEPTPGPQELLVKVSKTAICGTDLHIFQWDAWSQRSVSVPQVLGHEFVGEVAGLGAEVEGFKVGDRISGEGHITCGQCRNCRAGRRHLCRATQGIGVQAPGAFAEYLVIPASNAFRVPASLSDDVAAIFDPLGNAVHTALSFDLVGEDVLVTGAGPIGLMAAAIARHAGARHVLITDVNDYRLSLAKQLGIEHVLNAQRDDLGAKMAELGIVEGIDVGLEVSGSPAALRQMIEVMNHGGSVALLGILPDDCQIDWTEVVFKSLQLKGIYGREMFETWYKMAAMLQAGLAIDPVITHRFPASRFDEAFELMTGAQCGKVILDWSA